MPETTLSREAIAAIGAPLHSANRAVAERFPGDSSIRQPVHTVYGGAHLFTADIAVRLGASARKTLAEYAPTAEALAEALDFPSDLASTIYPRIVDKLAREPVEDFRIDFEDGFGNRPDEEEDRHARLAATEVATGLRRGTLPPGIGIRIKTLSEELAPRSLRTLDLFLTTLLEASGGVLPPRFAVTLPKITCPEQVAALASACDAFEQSRGLAPRALSLELMVETPHTVFAAEGTIALPALVAAGGGRVVGAHFGTYDYTAGLAITAAHQHMRHPACDFAKHVMQVSLAGTGIHLSDGATNILPIAPHHAPTHAVLLDRERHENAAVVHRAWRLHRDDIRHSLSGGFYQGWDLHPAQLPSRYATVYAFFLESLGSASERLRNFVARAAQATVVGGVFDDAATGQGLLTFFLRATSCGAVSLDEAVASTGLTEDEIHGRSFLKILTNRRGFTTD